VIESIDSNKSLTQTAHMMKTSADRLRWFIEFAQRSTDDQELKDWEYLKLREEVAEFIGGSDTNERFRFSSKREPITFTKHDVPIYEPITKTLREEIEQWLTREQMAELVDYAYDYLSVFLATQAVTDRPITFRRDQPPVEHTDKTKFVTKDRQHTIRFGSPTVSFHMPSATWFIEAKPVHLFFIRFGLVLMEEGTSEIQTCPECHRAFYRVRKQIYCSKTCINRVSRRNWLKNPKNRKKDREWAHERYERRVKEKTNGNVKVQNRSRKKGGKN
jgi:hypothetical protein